MPAMPRGLLERSGRVAGRDVPRLRGRVELIPALLAVLAVDPVRPADEIGQRL